MEARVSVDQVKEISCIFRTNFQSFVYIWTVNQHIECWPAGTHIHDFLQCYGGIRYCLGQIRIVSNQANLSTVFLHFAFLCVDSVIGLYPNRGQASHLLVA